MHGWLVLSTQIIKWTVVSMYVVYNRSMFAAVFAMAMQTDYNLINFHRSLLDLSVVVPGWRWI